MRRTRLTRRSRRPYAWLRYGGDLSRLPPFAHGEDGHNQIGDWATRVDASLIYLASTINMAGQSARADVQTASNLAETTLNMIVADAQKEFLTHREAISLAYSQNHHLIKDTRGVVDTVIAEAKGYLRRNRCQR